MPARLASPASLAAAAPAAAPASDPASDPTSHRWRNRDQLRAYASAADPGQRLQLRNRLVAANLGLVFGLARSLGHSHRLDHDDLAQVASLGLIRAVEAYDPQRCTALSTFAMPYIRGAILHELRDRRHLVRVPRDLWELRQQVNRLQEQRRRNGAAPLSPRALADRLGCGEHQLRDLEALPLLEAPCSLDAPAPGSAAAAEARPTPLLEQLPAPQAATALEPQEPEPESPELQWLRRQLAQLDPAARELLLGRLQLGCTWVELGQRLGLPPRQAQRRCSAVQKRLKVAADQWRQAQATAMATAQVGRTSG